MSFKPWKQPLLAAFALVAGTTAATAQSIQTAQRSIEVGRFNDARAMLRNNSAPEAAFELGRVYQLRNLPDSSAFFFNKASGTTPFGQVAAGRALLVKGQVAPAESLFEAAIKATKSKDPKILTMIAQAYAESDLKDITKAQEYLTAAQAANKGKVDPAMMIVRGDVFLHSSQGGGEAMNSYDQAIAANPSFAQAYYKKGQLNVRSRNFNAARESLNKAVELDPSYAPAYRELADMYYYAGQYDLALSSFQKYINLAEKSPATDAQYASFLYLTKKYPEALAEVNKVLQVEPNNLTMNRLRPYLLYETGDYAGAAAALETYMKVAPPEKIISEDLAYKYKIMSKSGKGSDAIAGINQLIKQDPSKACDFQDDLASIYANQKNYKGVASVYRYKLNNCKGDLTDQFRLAVALTGDKQYTRADSVYNIILTAKPTYAPGYLARAKVNSLIDPEAKKGLAKPYYEKYIELSKAEGADPAKFKEGVVEANGYLGVYNFQKGDKAAALSYFEQVLAMDPENKGAENNIKILKAKPKATAPASKAPAKKK
ncbi:tetratricopeptide repeat protein [Hymenobacter sp. BT664]|uniref:Tetratricopeptide repeat protein n=1 Tax=Hymenobacter montanus TaxID=2771359 RepID=A0A927GK58_9BACT|nr:tetratricopeptide repeat protein [Hymenobacter montanus]MBD2768806.1 tetratricopeptide repeat protein [Hymenobacter montanus]